MGVKMSKKLSFQFVMQSLLLYAGLPLLILFIGNYPSRALYKEMISCITIVAFCLMTGQFYWSRINTYAAQSTRAGNLHILHSSIGYFCTIVLFLHPFLLVVPRFFEKGVAPLDALIIITTTFSSKGIVLGLIAWILMLIIGITSVLRRKLPLRYRDWRSIHGLLSVLFIVTGAWHAIDLGRHASVPMSSLFIVLTGGGVLLLLITEYSPGKIQKPELNNEAL